MTLLRSKIHAPALPPNTVERPRLLDPILDGDHALVLLQAPAGYGKSVLAIQILEEDPARPAWLHLEPEDADPKRFCRYLAGALAAAEPSLGRTELPDAPGNPEFTAAAWLEDLVLFLEEFPRKPIRLVLDNFESVSDAAAISDLVGRLLRHRPAHLSLLITTRTKPRIPLQKLIERGDALALGIDDLSFSLDEFRAAAAEQGKTLSERELERLWARSEGWCVSINLGLEAPAGHTREPAAASAYLDEEILGGLPESLRSFLRTASVVDVINDEIAAGLGIAETDLRKHVEDLSRHGVPHLKLEAGTRLHPMIREGFLQELGRDPAALEPDGPAGRAVTFLRSRGRLDDAIRLLIRLGAFERVLNTLDADWSLLERNNLLSRVGAWLDLLPQEFAHHPVAVLGRARYLRFTGDNRSLLEMLVAEKQHGNIPTEGLVAVQLWTAEVWARSSLGEGLDYDTLSREWRELSASADLDTELSGDYALFLTALYQLRLDEALDIVRGIEAKLPEDTFSKRVYARNSYTVLRNEQGESEEVIRILDDTIAQCRQAEETTYVSAMLIGKSFTLKDLGRFTEALQAVEESMAALEEGARDYLRPHANRVRGECAYFSGRPTEALEFLNEAYTHFLDTNRYEALATGVLIDHWKSVAGLTSNLVQDEDFTGPLRTCEARVRYLIRRSRQEAMRGSTETALARIREAHDMAHGMPGWRATCRLTEAWTLDQDPTAGDVEHINTALAEGLDLLESLGRTVYPMADPELTGWVVTEAIATDTKPDRAVSLIGPKPPFDLQPAFDRALRAGGRTPEQLGRLLRAATRFAVRGLESFVRDLETVAEAETAAYLQTVADAPLPPLTVRMFGRFEALRLGAEIRFARKASRHVFQALLVEHPRPVHEERLMEMLWPESDPTKAKASLQTAINELRRGLDPHHEARSRSYVAYEDETYALLLPEGTDVDYMEFTERRGSPQEILALYRGDLLAQDPYEEYAAEPRERARASFLEVSLGLTRTLRASAPEAALGVLSRGLDVDPYWSEGVAEMMQLLHGQGRPLAAIRTYREYEKRLQDDVGLEPDEPLRRLLEELTR